MYSLIAPLIIVLCAARVAPTELPPSTTQPESPTTVNEDITLIGFVTSTVTVSEGGGVAVLCYSIIEGRLIQAFRIPSVLLSVSVVDITATADVDYESISSSLLVTFGRDVSTDCFHVPILEDSIPEGSENFTVTLSSSDRSLVMITQDTVQVVIVDTCLDGEVRLRGGFDEFQGRVEICFNGVWGTVCDDDWDDSDARVVCRQLGYPNSEVVSGFQRAAYGEGVGPILLDEVRCNGDEPELVSCTHDGFNVHDCGHDEDSSVDCLGRRVGEPCSVDGDVRLVNGEDETQGRVEFCYDGVWGTVCDDLWDDNDARVVCRQLGFNETRVLAHGQAEFGGGFGEIILDNVECLGNESTLVECTRQDFFVSNCAHTEDAGVECNRTSRVGESCSVDGDVRLVNGQDETQGRVEFCYDRVWGTVCDFDWDDNDAAVVCRQLGFIANGAISVGQARFGEGVGEIVLDDVECSGNESALIECPRREFFVHDCTHAEDAGVDCRVGEPCSVDGDLRLVNGLDETQGRVEFCYDGVWGTICDDSWDNNDAKVVCRQLGFNGTAVALERAAFGEGFGDIVLDNVGCFGNENKLIECPRPGFLIHNCAHSEDAGVDCTAKAGEPCSVHGDVRLVRGRDTTDGAVEICYEGLWGTVCDDGWDDNDAMVVCRQLGLNDTGAVALRAATFGEGFGEIVLSEISCSGDENTLLECPRRGFTFRDCDHTEDAGVDCSGSTPDVVRVGFEFTSTVVVEDVRFVEVCVAVFEGIPPPNSIALEVVPGPGEILPGQFSKRQIEQLATFGLDYSYSGGLPSLLIFFSPFELRTCFEVEVFDDTVPEATEIIRLLLTDPDYNYYYDDLSQQIEIVQPTVEIAIIDNDNVSDSAGVGFTAFQEASVIEGDTLQVCVGVLVGSLSTDVPLVVMATQGSAIFGEDFIFAGNSESPQTTFTLGPTQVEYCFDIITIDDVISEEELTIVLVLIPGNPQDQFNIVEPIVTIFLFDNDINCGDGHLCIDLEFSGQPRCLPPSFICNGSPDCRDGSDEQGCDNIVECGDDAFTCLAENRCLPLNYVCDGIPDCQIGGGVQFDELNCITDCVDGDLLPLLGGTSDSEGIVEICVNGQFRALTLGTGGDDRETLSIREATVICKQLGKGTAGFPLSGRSAFGFQISADSSGDLAFLQCNGNETRVADCRLSVGDFDSRQAGVRCINETPCIDGSVRLADGPNEREGRVEVCFQNTWGVVYDANWEDMEAAVVCRELGFEFNGAVPISTALYEPLNSDRPVALLNPTCRAENRNLTNCTSFDVQLLFQFILAGFVDVAGVRCEEYSSGNCRHLDVRLGLRANEIGSAGLVEICNEGLWSPLVVVGGIDLVIAEIVCRQLNLTATTTTAPMQQTLFNAFTSVVTSLNTLPFNPPLSCEGSERSLMECSPSEPIPIDDMQLVQLGVQCRAPPRIFSIGTSPPSLDGVHEVELGRPATIFCLWDRRIFPPVTTFEVNTVDFNENMRDESSAPFAVPILQSNSAELSDDREYVCTATNSDNVTVSSNMRIKIRVPEGVGESAFIRFSVPALERLNATGGPDSIFQDREELFNLLEQTIILPTIDVDTPGLQTVECYSLPRGVFEVERELERVECNITQYQRQEEPVVSAAQIAERAIIAVESSFSVFVLGNSSASGFCNSEVTVTGGVSYSWPEVTGGTLFIAPCPMNPSISVTRRCGGGGQWEEPNVRRCSGGPSNITCEAESVSSVPGEAAIYIYDWPTTVAGENATITCINSGDLITRNCALNGEWGPFDDDICGVLLDDELEMLLNQTVNNGTYVELTSQLSTILDQSEGNVADQSQRNLEMVAQVFESVAMFVNESDIQIEPAVVQSLVQSLDSLLQWNQTVLINESSSNVVESFETIVALFAQQVEVGENETIVVQDLVLVAERRSLQSLQQNGRGFSFSELSDGERLAGLGNSDEVTPGGLAPQQVAAIRLPPSLFQTIENGPQTPGGNVGVFFAVYDVPSLFPPSPKNVKNENRTVGTRVLASTVGPGINIDNLIEPVSIVLRLTLNTSQRLPGTEMCVSWDFILDDWTNEGCVTGVGSDGVVTCNCTHLTNFAVLVDVCSRAVECEINETFDKALSFITIIGVSVSLLGLTLTVLTLLMFPKLRQKDASKYHIQLSIAIFCMLLVFIAGVKRTENYGGCVTVSVLIHYFTLVAVMFMGAEALLMFQKLVFVFRRVTTKFIIILSIVCWLVPLIPVLIPLIVDLATGNDPNDDIVVRQDQFCFLNHLGALYGAFLALIFLVVIFNLVIFIIVIYVLIKHTRGQLSRQQERMKPATVIRLMISITGVMFLFGLSWLFAALSITNPGVRYTFQVLFTVFTAFQGFFIFLFFCVFSKEARESWKEFLSCGKYKSQFLHPSHYKPPTSSAATAKRGMNKTMTGTTTMGSTGIASSTLGRPYYSSDTIPKTDYGSETLTKTDLGSEIEKPSIIYENPVATFESSTFEASTVETSMFREPATKTEKYDFETNAPRESLEFSVEEIMSADTSTTELLAKFPESDHSMKFAEPEHVKKFAETNLDVENQASAHSQNENTKELKPLKARVKRFSTRKAYAHHVESMQVEFYSDDSDWEEPTEL